MRRMLKSKYKRVQSMRPKDHKKKAVDLLKILVHWIENSKFDYREDDFTDILQEVKDRYVDYVELKRNPKYESKIDNKSYK